MIQDWGQSLLQPRIKVSSKLRTRWVPNKDTGQFHIGFLDKSQGNYENDFGLANHRFGFMAILLMAAMASQWPLVISEKSEIWQFVGPEYF